MRSLAASALILAAALGAPALHAIVISEIHYHPPVGEEGLEFIEVANETGSPEDISGYSFTEGIQFTFPAGTILAPAGYIVVAADAALLKAHYPVESVLGNYTGKLDNGGETITLVNQAGALLLSMSYKDGGKWPVAPDGTGHSLVLKNTRLDPREPESWTQSPELGGSPGRANLPDDEPRFKDEVFIESGDAWRYAKGTQPFSTPEGAWRETTFDDSSWLEGPSGFGFADGDDRTVLDDMLNGYSSLAIRRRFSLEPSQLEAAGDFYLAADYDDGFCAYLNGKEIARASCGPPETEPVWNGVATARRERGKEELFKVPRELVAAGENVLAIAGFNYRITDNDFSLIPRFLRRSPIDSSAGARPAVLFNELFRGPAPGSGWIEIYNAGSSAADLSDYTLTDDPERADPFHLPSGSIVEARGFLVLDEAASGLNLSAPKVQLFLLALDGIAVAASTLDAAAPAAAEGFSEARFPDGGRQGWITLSPTRGAANRVDRSASIVLNEIFYHPPEDRRGEFIEIYNRGKHAVNLSGFRFDKGVEFAFQEGTSIEAGGYLVVAEDPAIILANHGVAALGPWEGVLADSGENVRLVDGLGNLVSEVRYSDGGSWARWADGGGSSLELIDPNQDETAAAAWDASDEEGKAPWQQLTFHVPSYQPASTSELHLFLAERGVCSLDDVSITRDGGDNLIPNPDFEATTSPWVIQGTHIRSRRITTDSHSGSASLELAASGKGDTLVNRIEIDTRPALSKGPYDVSLWARWRRGGTLLVAHGEYTAGPYGGRPSPAINLSGNTLSAGLKLAVPWNLGTPGAENSARRKLREATGSGNLGPAIDEARHWPACPRSSLPVSVTARVRDPDGVSRAQVLYRQGSANGDFLPVDLLDDGAHGDGAAGDGLYGGELPGSADKTKVVFYIEAEDGAGAVSRYPVGAPAATCLYMVQDSVNDRLDGVRVFLDGARTSELQSRALHSNDLLPGTLVFDDKEVYYNVGVRYRSSPWGRPSRANYRVRFEDDRRFLRGRRAINLSSRGAAPNEGAVYFLCGRNGGPDRPTPSQDYFYVKASIQGAPFATYGVIQPVDRDFLVKWYGEAAAGPALKVEGRRQLNDSGDLAGMWDGASFTYRHDDKENYRNYFIPGIRRSVDDWNSFNALCRIMDRKQTPDASFDGAIEQVLDVEEFLRVLSVRIVTSDWDAFGAGNGHNGFLTVDPGDGRWELLPFDVDNTFSNASWPLFPAADGDVARLLNRPRFKRLYYRVLANYLDGYWSPVTAKPYLDAVQAASGVSTGVIKSYLTTNSTYVRNQIKLGTQAVFRIVTNSGNDVAVDGAAVELEGEAPVRDVSIAWQRNKGKVQVLEPVWSSPVRWKAAFELAEAESTFEFAGIDSTGNAVDSASITVRTFALPGVFLRGDVNRDRLLNLTDPIVTLRHLFRGGSMPCADAADFNDDGKMDLTDAVNGLEYLFREGAPPPAPFPGPGLDPTEDALDCSG